jgi:hypothetical protein
VALAATVAIVVAGGGPVRLAQRAYDAFVAAPPHPQDLNKRLFSFSGNGRADLWRVAWRDYENHVALGSGGGSYGRYFLAHQPTRVAQVVDAHNLYLETLTETGPVGLALLLVVLATPLFALRFARRAPLAAAAAGAYVAFVVHAAVDWDWELAAVACAALILARIVLVEDRTRVALPTTPAKAAVLAVVAVIAAFSLVGLIGNSALATSDTATANGNVARGVTYARRAIRWMPWSADPWRALGAAQRSANDPADAQASFRKGLSIDPGDWQLWYGLALTSRGSTQTRAYARAVALFPRGGLRRPGHGSGGAP